MKDYTDKYPNDYELPEWSHPDNYGGFSPDGDFHLLSQHRDSDPITRSNYRVMMRELERIAETLPAPETDGEHDQGASWFYDFHASHWAVGWIEHLLIRRDAPDEMQREAYEMLAALEEYPVLSDDDLIELESNEAFEWWRSMSISERMGWCADAGVSVFAARRDDMSESIELEQSLREGLHQC